MVDTKNPLQEKFSKESHNKRIDERKQKHIGEFKIRLALEHLDSPTRDNNIWSVEIFQGNRGPITHFSYRTKESATELYKGLKTHRDVIEIL